ncbi:hypothetical protein ACFL58_00870 [Elusimicrobiota bacterium]
MKFYIKSILYFSILFITGLANAGFVSDRVGVGIVNPNDLEVAGRITVSSFTMTTGASSGYVLRNSVGGNAYWCACVAISSTNTWSGGNTYLGASTMTALTLDTINHKSALITIANDSNDFVTSGTGNIGISTGVPQAKLDVNGAVLSNQTILSNTDGGATLDFTGINSYIYYYNANGASSPTNVTAITGGEAGQMVTFFYYRTASPTNRNLTIVNKAGANGIVTGTNGNITLTANDGGCLILCFNGTYWYIVNAQL